MRYTPREPARPRRFYYAEDLTAEQVGQSITTTAADGWPVRGVLQSVTERPAQGVVVLEVARRGRTAASTVTRREGVIVHTTTPNGG